jgi:hypothetical protein
MKKLNFSANLREVFKELKKIMIIYHAVECAQISKKKIYINKINSYLYPHLN